MKRNWKHYTMHEEIIPNVVVLYDDVGSTAMPGQLKVA